MGCTNEDAAIRQDIQDVESLDAVSSILSVVCEITGMGFAAVARVTQTSWTAMAVRDDIAFGLRPGHQLDIHTTLCKEVREARRPVVIDHASTDPVYCGHPTPRRYNFESYISVPIALSDGSYFGNLCAIDLRPHRVSEPRIVNLFVLFSRLIALQLENQRRRRQAEADVDIERANSALREQFIAIVGHDLRNPLAGIHAGVAVLEQVSNDPGKVLKVAGSLARGVRRMTLLVDDIADFARGRLGGGFGVEIRPVDNLALALEQVVAELRSAYPGRAVEVAISVNETVQCDPARVEQLASNLLANALFFGTPAAPVLFRTTVQEDKLAITVVNHGAPIPAEAIPKLFDAFTQGAQHTRNGLGLGLFICAQVVKAHGGSLDVTSSEEEGTAFTAKLPLRGLSPAQDARPLNSHFGSDGVR
jgi:signal transduction histidine kinase